MHQHAVPKAFASKAPRFYLSVSPGDSPGDVVDGRDTAGVPNASGLHFMRFDGDSRGFDLSTDGASSLSSVCILARHK